MTVAVPEPLPLDMPPEDPHALADLVESVAGAASCLATLDRDLAGAARSAPDWLGADAAAATARIGVVTGLAGNCSRAVLVAVGRLVAHHDLVTAARRTVAVLRAEQDDDFAAAWARLSHLEDSVAAVRTDAPAALAVVEELRSAEEGRRRRHAAVLEDLASDAAVTVRVLAGSSAVVGGRGAPGDANLAVAFLAAELPGWGAQELAARGLALARALAWAGPRERATLVSDAMPYAGRGPFATALLLALGVAGIRALLSLLGDGSLLSDRGTARLLGLALGSAEPAGTGYDPVGELLTASYVDPDGDGRAPDLVVLGMGAVLAATRSAPAGGPPLRTVLAWGQQMIARERAQEGSLIGSRALDREQPQGGALPHDDPMTLVAERLAGAADPAFAAALLADRSAWEVLLSRPWDDGAATLAGLVARAGNEPGAPGDAAVRAGLEALGAGLRDGDPADRTVDRGTAAVVAPAMGGAVAAHVTVAADALWSAVQAQPEPPGSDALRGLGYLTLDTGAAVAVYRALGEWARIQPGPVGESVPLPPLPGVVVPAAYAAVEEYGQRLAYALHGFELEAQAEADARTWNLTVGLVVGLLPGRGGLVGGVIAGYAARWCGMDGRWDNGPDRGLVFARADAVGGVLDTLPPGQVAAVEQMVAQAEYGYDRTADVLGLPKPPTSPVIEWWQPGVEALVPSPLDDVTILRHIGRELREADRAAAGGG